MARRKEGLKVDKKVGDKILIENGDEEGDSVALIVEILVAKLTSRK